MAFSSDPFERLTFGGVYSRSFVLLMERLDLFMTVAILMFVPFLIIQVTFPGVENLDEEADSPFMTNPNGDQGEAQQMLYGKLAGFYAELFFSTFVGIIGNAAIAVSVAQMYVNGHPDTMVCLKKGLSKFCTLFCGQFLFGVVLGLCILVASFIGILLWMSEILFLRVLVAVLFATVFAGYFYCSIAVTLYVPIIMIEGKDAVAGLKRSLELVSNNFCFVLCASVCLTIMVAFVAVIFSLFTMGGLLGTAIEKLPFLFQFPLQSILIVVVYFNLRITHEGMNRDVLVRELNTIDGEYNPVAVVDVEAEAVAIVDDKA